MSTVDVVRLLGNAFIERRDVKAVQGEPHVEKGGPPLPWQPIKSPFTMQDFSDHLDGTRTFGHYMVNPEGNTCKLFAFDIDLRENKDERRNARGDLLGEAFEGRFLGEEGFQACDPREDWGKVDHPARKFLTNELRLCAVEVAEAVEKLGIPVAVALSGHKGIHVYGLTGSIAATVCRETATTVMAHELEFTATRGDNFFVHPVYHNLMVEVFPKPGYYGGKGPR